MRALVFAFAALTSLGACSGGEYVGPAGPAKTTPATTGAPPATAVPGTTASPSAATTASSAPTLAPGATASPTPAATATATATPSPSASPDPYLVVSNNTAGTYVQFPTVANGNAAPTNMVSPACGTCSGVAASPNGKSLYYVLSDDVTIYNVATNTQFTSSAIAAIGVFTVDASGQIFVADTTNDSILVFPANSSGPYATPTRTIAGANTLINDPSGIAVAADGTIYSVNNQDDAVHIYPPGANGNVAPGAIYGSNTGLSQTFGLAVNAAGQILVSTQGDGLLGFAPGANGNATPVIHTGDDLDGADSGVCTDPVTGDIFVVRHGGDNDIVGFDRFGTLKSDLGGSATTLSNPKNCAISTIPL